VIQQLQIYNAPATLAGTQWYAEQSGDCYRHRIQSQNRPGLKRQDDSQVPADRTKTMSIWRWADLIDPVPEACRVTLGEGNTALVRSRKIGPSIGLNNLQFKLEQGNPTGSYKDRFAAAAISHMVVAGAKNCIATSSGNTGSALAAYCTAADIRCRIAIVEGAPDGKLRQMLAYGASIVRIRGFGTDSETTVQVFRYLKDLAKRPDWSLQVSAFVFSAPGMSGVQTISYELAEQCEHPVAHVFCPAGGGGMCVAVARGFRKLQQLGRLSEIPQVHCAQPEGNDTIVTPLRNGLERARSVACTTAVSGLQVASVVDGDLTIEECRATGGTGFLVSDEEVWAIQKRLAREEGIFTEPAGAVSVAAAARAAAEQRISKDDPVVCMVTGSGFKDEAALVRLNSDVTCPLLDFSELNSWT
jgi:threonine synthase